MYRYSKTFQEKPYTTDRAVLIENHPLMLMVTQNQKVSFQSLGRQD